GKLRQFERQENPPALTLAEDTSIEDRGFVLVKSDFKVFRFFYRHIYYIESMKEYVAYHTPEGRTLSLGSLKKLEQELPADQFIRIHKSYIANIRYMSVLEGNLVHVKDKKLPIGTYYREAVLDRVF
ncbi:MAG: LytTR family transcriptional regulator, partial [Phaeodactylibacter sp.]|nr:LytTR family transcriptional regulator [Phaeodactylibacter sp.]